MGTAVARFLVVEDDPLVAPALVRIVRPYGEATVAGTVGAARQQLAAQPSWDGFIIDLGLPDGSGLDVLGQARASFPDAPALVLTGHTGAHEINAAYDLNADYVVKPVRAERLRRFLDAAISSRKAPEPCAGERSGVPLTLEGCIERLRELRTRWPDVPTRYAIGAIVAEIKAHPARYGNGGIAAVAAAVGEDVPSLYRHAAVAERLERGEVEALAAHKGADGRALSWSHIVLLGSIPAARVRKRLTRRALAEGLSVRELGRLVEAVGRGQS